MEAKQYAAKQPRDHWGNQKIPRHKLQSKHDDPKPMGCSKRSSKRDVYSKEAYLKKKEKYQINNLTLHLKE